MTSYQLEKSFFGQAYANYRIWLFKKYDLFTTQRLESTLSIDVCNPCDANGHVNTKIKDFTFSVNILSLENVLKRLNNDERSLSLGVMVELYNRNTTIEVKQIINDCYHTYYSYLLCYGDDVHVLNELERQQAAKLGITLKPANLLSLYKPYSFTHFQSSKKIALPELTQPIEADLSNVIYIDEFLSKAQIYALQLVFGSRYLITHRYSFDQLDKYLCGSTLINERSFELSITGTDLSMQEDYDLMEEDLELPTLDLQLQVKLVNTQNPNDVLIAEIPYFVAHTTASWQYEGTLINPRSTISVTELIDYIFTVAYDDVEHVDYEWFIRTVKSHAACLLLDDAKYKEYMIQTTLIDSDIWDYLDNHVVLIKRDETKQNELIIKLQPLTEK